MKNTKKSYVLLTVYVYLSIRDKESNREKIIYP
jgi:hypothetical protein